MVSYNDVLNKLRELLDKIYVKKTDNQYHNEGVVITDNNHTITTAQSLPVSQINGLTDYVESNVSLDWSKINNKPIADYNTVGIIKLDSTPSSTSMNAVSSKGVHNALSSYMTINTANNTYLKLTGGDLTGNVSSNSNITTTGNVTGNKIIKKNGTNSQLLLADGSVKSTNDFAVSGHVHNASSITFNPSSSVWGDYSPSDVGGALDTVFGVASDHSHGIITVDGKIMSGGTLQKSKNLCTDSNGLVSVEAKNNHTHTSSMITFNPSSSWWQQYNPSDVGKGLDTVINLSMNSSYSNGVLTLFESGANPF